MTTNTSGTQDPYKNVDPNGLQAGSTVSAAAGFVALAASGGPEGGMAALFSHSPHLATAGISLASLGHMDLFTVGLTLVGLAVVLNVASLVIRRQYARDADSVSGKPDA
jgi:hypothetical protein